MTPLDASPPHALHARPRANGLDALPGPEPVPVVGWRGNFLRFGLDPLGYVDMLAKYGKLAIFTRGMKGGVFGRRSDDVPGTVFAYGPELLGRCFNSGHAVFRSIHLAPPPGRGYARLNWGLQWLHGDEHRQHRKMVMPAFHGRRLDAYRDVLVQAASAAMDRWRPGEFIDIVDETRRLLLVFLDRAFLGMENTTGVMSIGAQLEDIWRRSMSLPVRIPVDFPYSPRRRASARADRLSDAFDELVRAKRAAGGSGDDMFSMLLEARDEGGRGMTEDQLIGQLSFLIFAGFESTIHAVAFAAYLVAQHPAVAAKLYEESFGLLQGDAPTVAQLNQLPYLDAVVKESLRILSPVPFLLRTTDEPVELGGYELPARTELMLSFYHTHRMPEIYAEPHRFLPERWETLKVTSYEYMPFSVGPHLCAGRALALMELKVLLSMFSQRFRLDIADGERIDRKMLATLGPRGGLRMRVEAQDREFSRSRGQVRGDLASMVALPD